MRHNTSGSGAGIGAGRVACGWDGVTAGAACRPQERSCERCISRLLLQLAAQQRFHVCVHAEPHSRLRCAGHMLQSHVASSGMPPHPQLPCARAQHPPSRLHHLRSNMQPACTHARCQCLCASSSSSSVPWGCWPAPAQRWGRTPSTCRQCPRARRAGPRAPRCLAPAM